MAIPWHFSAPVIRPLVVVAVYRHLARWYLLYPTFLSLSRSYMSVSRFTVESTAWHRGTTPLSLAGSNWTRNRCVSCYLSLRSLTLWPRPHLNSSDAITILLLHKFQINKKKNDDNGDGGGCVGGGGGGWWRWRWRRRRKGKRRKSLKKKKKAVQIKILNTFAIAETFDYVDWLLLLLLLLLDLNLSHRSRLSHHLVPLLILLNTIFAIEIICR